MLLARGLTVTVAMSTLASPHPPSLLRAGSKRQSVAAYMTTSSSTMQLTAPTVMPPAPPALSHSTLTTLSPYLTNALTATPFSAPDSSSPYRPRPTSPLPAAAFTSAPSLAPVDSQRALLDALVRLNREREDAEQRLRDDVAAKVGAAAEATAVMAEEGLQRAEARIRDRALLQWEREQQRRKQAGEEEKEQAAAAAGAVLGWTQEQAGGEKEQWEVKEAPVAAAADDKRKGSKREKEREEKERRMRDTSLAFSPLSTPPSASQLSALLPPASSPAGYIGSALAVSLSAFRSSTHLRTTAEAAALLSPSSSLPAPSLAAFAAAAPPALDPLLSLYAGASLLPAAPLASSFLSASSPPLLPALQSAVSPRSEQVRQQRLAAAEAAHCKQRLSEAGVFVHQGVLDRALGAGDGGVTLLLPAEAGALPSTAAGGAWPVPFSSLMPDPKEKKKKAASEKKPVAKKAGKKK